VMLCDKATISSSIFFISGLLWLKINSKYKNKSFPNVIEKLVNG